MEILKATSLSKIYQTGESAVYALNDMSMSIDEGSFVAITGPSGSGKSTLLHLLSGLDKPTKGTAYYRDKDLYKYNDNQLSVLRRRRFGFVFQSYNLVKELTGYVLGALKRGGGVDCVDNWQGYETLVPPELETQADIGICTDIPKDWIWNGHVENTPFFTVKERVLASSTKCSSVEEGREIWAAWNRFQKNRHGESMVYGKRKGSR